MAVGALPADASRAATKEMPATKPMIANMIAILRPRCLRALARPADSLEVFGSHVCPAT